jgi:hypothetical protein
MQSSSFILNEIFKLLNYYSTRMINFEASCDFSHFNYS